MELNRIIQHDVKQPLPLEDKSVHCCVTSPPYWGLRDYGKEGQLGLEKTPEEYISNMVNVFREVKRVLKDDGTIWVNIGDSYNGYPGNVTRGGKLSGANQHARQLKERGYGLADKGLKPKDLVGIPWMLAFALRADGWYLRQDIIWHKPNPMPESVTDRCTKSHEYIFLLSKSQKYYYDAEAIKQPLSEASISRLSQNIEIQLGSDRVPGKTNGRMKAVRANGIVRDRLLDYDSKEKQLRDQVKRGGFEKEKDIPLPDALANKRSVWTVTTKPYSDAHFATFPEDLIVDCIKAGSSEYGCCASCGNPYVRQFDKELIPGPKASYNSKVDNRDLIADKQDQGSNRMKDGHKPGWLNKTTTTGWQPSCICENPIVTPCLILDPFMGAGTTALVSAKLNRNFIGFELNEKYIKIAEKRLQKELGMFNPLRA